MSNSVISGIYGLCDPNTGELRYIGLSKNINDRAYYHWTRRNTNQCKKRHLYKWINKLGEMPQLIILEELTENLHESEMFWISYYKSIGCKLVNHTNGGEGLSGYKFSDEDRKNISIKTKEAMANLSSDKKEKLKNRKGTIPINRIKLIDQYGTIYSSLTEAAEKINCNVSAITFHFKNKTKAVKGYTFRKISNE